MEITGYVKYQTGDAVQQANVLITTASVPIPEIAAVSNASGWFRLAGLDSGDYTVSAFHDDGIAKSTLSLCKSTEIALVLDEEHRV